MNAVIVTVQLVPEKCCNCGVVFGLDSDQAHRLRNSGEWFYCPNGHRQHFTKTEADRLREQLADMTRYRDNARMQAKWVQDQYDAERRQHASTKGQLTKTRKRVGNGVCPCCNRSFANLQRHMSGQHPDYAGAS